METLTKEVLKLLNNKHTKVELKEDFNGNYYSYLTDTVYISKNFSKQKVPKAAKDINKKAAEVIVVCHECIHSIQNKSMHILNMVFSNLSIILTVISIVLSLFWTGLAWFELATGAIILLSVITRIILEHDAINRSTSLAFEAVSKGIVQNASKEDIEEGIRYIQKHKYLAILQMIADKIVFLIVVLIMK